MSESDTFMKKSEREKRRDAGGAGPGDRVPPIPGMMMGAVLGLLGGLGFAGWEAAVLGRSVLGLPAQELLVIILVLYAVTGALFGGLAGITRLSGGAWAFATMMIAASWLVSGKVGMAMAETGGWASLGVLVLVPLTAAIVLILGRLQIPDGVFLGVATLVFLVCAVGLPLNHHLLPGPTTKLALMVDVVIGLGAVIVGGIVAAAGTGVGTGAAPPVVILGGLIGWGFAWPVLDSGATDWPTAEADVGPPVVLVVVDTLRADHLGLYGYDRPTSPLLDAAGQRAIVYLDASSTAPWTLPSVATILTSLPPGRHGAGIHDGSKSLQGSLRFDVDTLAGLLSEHGYATAGVVTNPWASSLFGFDQGFDYYDDAQGPGAMPAGVHPLHVLGLDPTGWPLFRSGESITDRALSFVEAQEQPSWFLFVLYMDVHGPRIPEPQDVEAVGKGKIGAEIDHYDAAVHQLDRALGRLLEGLPDDAWVVVTADHGEQLTERRDAPKAMPPGTQHGFTMYQEMVHVPLIVIGPDIGPYEVDRTVSTVDIAPTLLRLVGADIPETMVGEPLYELTEVRATPERILYADSVRYGTEQQMLRQGKYKLISWHRGGMELVDLEADPREAEPLLLTVSENAEVARTLKVELPVVGASAISREAPVGPEMARLLARLGYVAEPRPVDEEGASEPAPEPAVLEAPEAEAPVAPVAPVGPVAPVRPVAPKD